ncbi:MAG: hypothetical protein FLDDKLPJ_00178 [Phycisphaerae bacterium]|nr:hypothetical protein [Phycisphaerae bacterium]
MANSINRSRSPRHPKLDPARERRIYDDIVVDAYGPEEQAMGWYYYLESTLSFPFTARCITLREVSPLEVSDEVEVIGMAGETECNAEMFVRIRWDRRGRDGGKRQGSRRGLAVPLIQLEPRLRKSDAATRQAVADWRYWVGRGYEFC